MKERKQEITKRKIRNGRRKEIALLEARSKKAMWKKLSTFPPSKKPFNWDDQSTWQKAALAARQLGKTISIQEFIKERTGEFTVDERLMPEPKVRSQGTKMRMLIIGGTDRTNTIAVISQTAAVREIDVLSTTPATSTSRAATADR